MSVSGGSAETRAGAAEFTIADGDSPLMGALLRAALEGSHPGCTVRSFPIHTTSGVRGEVTIRDERNGRMLCVFRETPGAGVVRKRMEAGGYSMMTLDASQEEFESALRALVDGTEFVSERVLGTLGDEPELFYLTPRESQVLQLVARGYTNREVAESLGMSPNTVRTHLQSLSARTGATSRGKLALMARSHGLE